MISSETVRDVTGKDARASSLDLEVLAFVVDGPAADSCRPVVLEDLEGRVSAGAVVTADGTRDMIGDNIVGSTPETPCFGGAGIDGEACAYVSVHCRAVVSCDLRLRTY